MKEIERKFLLKEGYKITDLLYVNKQQIQDQYLTRNIRVRHKDNDNFWMLTIKSEGQIERDEFEMPILVEPHFDNIPLLKKIRLTVPYLNQNFEINIFENIKYKGEPLVLIELELKDKDQVIRYPEWLGKEVTEDERFYGCELANFLKYKDFSIV